MSKKSRKISWFVLLFTSLSACTSVPSDSESSKNIVDAKLVQYADSSDGSIRRVNSSEKQTLVRLLRQLHELDNLISEADKNANPDARIKFDYNRLRYDLLVITNGISAHVDRPDYTPRTLEQIPGDYRD